MDNSSNIIICTTLKEYDKGVRIISDVKWIKITTNMFDDEKIKLIESMPDKDAILVIWVKLLIQAGKTNINGYVMLNENIPYTDEMLATIFNRPLNTVRLALKTFEDFGMIEMDDQGIFISNWGKHQSIDKLNKIKEQRRLRQEKHRKKKKLLEKGKKGNVTVTLSNGTDIELELDKELDKDKESNKDHGPVLQDEPTDKIPYAEIVNYLNERLGTNYRSSSAKTRSLIKARWNEGFRLKDFKTVIDKKAAEWMGDKKCEKWLRPYTLFSNKFENYLNQLSDDDSEDEEKMMEKYRKDDLVLTDEEREKLGLNKPRKNMWETEEE